VQFWFGAERFLQNTGAANQLKSLIPSAGMMAGDFTSAGAGNSAICPTWTPTVIIRTLQATTQERYAPASTAPFCRTASQRSRTEKSQPHSWIRVRQRSPASGQQPTSLLAESVSRTGNWHFLQSTTGNIYRTRVDYDLSDKDKFFVSYQYGTIPSLLKATEPTSGGRRATQFPSPAAAFSPNRIPKS